MVVRELSMDECTQILASFRLGRLGCARDNQPYVVPVSLVYHPSTTCEPCLYGFTTPGQKVEWMRSNPLVCVEFDNVTSHERWTSVIVFGRYDELLDAHEWQQERLHAHQVLQEQTAWWEPGTAVHATRVRQGHPGMIKPLYYRIRIDKMTGRQAVPEAT